MAGEIITPQEEGSPSDDVFEPFDVSIGLDFGKSGYVLSEGENLPVIVKNNMDRFVDFEVALYVNCPEVSYQKKILYTSAYADKLSEAGVEVELRRVHLLPNDNTLLCQIVPHVYAQNESGDLLKSIGTGVWIDPAQRQMKAYTQAQFDTLLKEKYNGGIPWRDMSTSRKDSIRKSGSRTSYVVNICAYWQTNYTDADASIGDDAYTSDGNKMARGVYMHIWKSGQTLFDGYTNISGCTGNLTVYSGTEYYLQMASVAELADSNRVVVYNDTDPADDSRSFSTVIYTLTPMVFTSGGTKNVNNGQLDPISNITAASAFAIYQHDGEMSTKTYTIKYSTESTWGNDCPG